MVYMIVAITAALFIYSSFKCWQTYRHRLIQHYPARRR